MIAEKTDKLLKIFQIIFYLGFIFLWFKGNFAPLRGIRVNPFLMLLLFIIVSSWRLIPKLKRIQFSFPRLSKQKLLAIMAIIAIGFLLRLPYLLNYKGLLTSDEVLFCLEGKHISEGKVPPICAYGQLYVGTLPSHFFALVFKIFGYSVFYFKLFTFLLYIGFVIFHFLFLSRFFPFTFSLFVALFYFLPLGYLVHISLDGLFILPIIFLLGLSIVYLTYLLVYEKKEKYLSWIGYLMGLSFWTHQMSVYFIVVSLFMIFLSYKFAFKKYLEIALYALIGFFPQLMLEIYYKFQLFPFLEPGRGIINWEKIKRTMFLASSLLTFSEKESRIIFVYVILIGFILLIWYAFRTKKYEVLKIYNCFFIFFFVIYLLSGHSNNYFLRYLYPLFFCLPVLFLSSFLFLREKMRYIAMTILCLLAVILFNWRDQYSYLLAVKEYHNNLKKIDSFLMNSGIKYWKGDFWTSYLFTALTGERVIIGSTSLRRYYPYELFYENYSEKENFIFLRGEGSEERWQAQNLVSLLETLKIPYKKKEIGECWLIYDINSSVNQFKAAPPIWPRIEEPQIETVEGFLNLSFKNLSVREEDISFWINVEIPQFSQVSKPFFLKDEKIEIIVPFPEKDSFPIIYYLDYLGTKIPLSYREIAFSVPFSAKTKSLRPEVVYLSGFGSLINYEKKEMRICQKKVKIEWNRKLHKGEKLCFLLYSPFRFNHPYWYGQFVQEVEIAVNDRLISKFKLKDGENLIKIADYEAFWKDINNVIVLTFKYHYRFGFSPRWKTSALLEKIFVE